MVCAKNRFKSTSIKAVFKESAVHNMLAKSTSVAAFYFWMKHETNGKFEEVRGTFESSSLFGNPCFN